MPRGPCRRGPGPRRHHCSWWHADLVESYRTARRAWEAEEEAVTMGYPAERAEFRASVPPPTFRAWLVGSRRPEEER